MTELPAPNLKIMAIHSYAIHGTASMKAFLSILGSRLLPVPSILLTGLTNISGFKKTSIAFEDLLLGSLELARQQKQKILLYIGYLGSADQAGIILKAIDSYSDCITSILVDPVSGDHGRLYVPQEILAVWPSLLHEAHWALPNYTELKWLSGIDPNQEHMPQTYLKSFGERFPNLSVIATSLPKNKDLAVGLLHQENQHYFPVQKLAQNYGGTGDVFAAIFLLHYFFKQNPLHKSIEIAARFTGQAIQHSMDQRSQELLVYPDIFL